MIRLLALLTLTAWSAIGAVTCSYSSATVNPVRIEGKTEQVGDYVMLCSNTGTGPVSLSITATMSQPVTSKAIGTMGLNEAAVIVKDTLNVQPTTATQGTTSGSQASFNVTVPPNSNSDSQYILYLTNIRIDATGLSVGASATEQVQVSQIGGGQLGNFAAQSVAVGVQGLGAQNLSGISSPPVCFSYSGTAPLFTVNFGENANDPAAFKTQGGSGNSAIGSWQSNNTETGYYVTSGGYNNQANSGTRIRVLLTGIPANTNVYIPLALSSQTAGSSNGYGTVSLTTSESGAYSAVSPATNPPGYQGTALGQLTVTNGTAEAVYEVSSQTLGAVENYAAPVYVVSTGTVPLTGSIGVTVSLAPVGASSNVPNFAQTSSTTPLTAPNCLTITSTAAANAIQSYAYSQNLSATGGQFPYTWSLFSGNPPGGLTVNSGGTITGTPAASPGSYPFTVQVLDANNATATQSLTITLNPAVSITTSTLANPAVSEAYSATLAAAYGNGGPYTWALMNGSSLPGGLTLSTGGVISGTPTTSGTYNFTVMATDTASGASAAKLLQLVVNPALSITTTSFPVGVVGTTYPNTGAAAAGGTGGLNWSLTSGMSALNAAGLSFSGSGVLSGTPTATGSIPITIKVTDQGGSATQNVTVQINAALSITTTSVPTGEVGVAVSYQLQYSGGTGAGSWLQAGGTLPSGVTISGSGLLSGTPTQSGSFGFTARFTDSLNDMANGAITWTVNAAPTVTTTLLPAGLQNSSYTATLAATGGSGVGYTWSVPAESLPTGLSLSPQGQLTGTPTVSGNYSIPFTVTDSLGGRGVQTLNFTIDAAGTIITTNIPSGDVIVNVNGAVYGAQNSSGPNQIYWQLPFNSGGGALLEYTLQPGTYTFRVIDPADAQAAFPSLTTPQLNSINTAWTYNSPYTPEILVFNATAVGNSAQNQLFSVAPINGLVYTAQAAYNLAISQGTYNAIAVGARNATPTYNYTFSVPTTLVFAVPDSGLYDNGGGSSILIAPVAATPISVTTPSLPPGLVNTSYGPVTLAATGGSGIYTWMISSLPGGLSGTPTGSISGRPNVAGNFSGVLATVIDSVSGTTASQTYSMQIDSNLSITTSSLTSGTVGQAYSQTLAATGGSGSSANYSWSATGLPTFLTLSPAGVLSGTPTSTGTFNNIAVTVMDTVTSQSANLTYSLTVNYPVVSFNYLSTALGLGPLGYFRLENTSGSGEVGGYTYSSTGATVQGGAPIGVTLNSALSLNGTNGAITTTLSGGITNAATLVAWVNLNTLPSAASNSILYVAGESQVGNDFDLQFTNDNYLRFYTTNGGQSIGYAPPTNNLAGQWHMLAATFANTAGKGLRAIYWDGVQVASDTTLSFPNKTTAFNIGATPVFSGRNFPGAIDEVGVWNSALSAAQIAEIYASTSGSLPTGVSGLTYPPITLYAKGGSGNFTWSATGLPAGLSLSSGGVLSGVPTTAGTSNPVITILDTGTSGSITPSAQIVVNPAVSIQTTALSTAALGMAYSSNIAISGGLAPYTFTVTAGSLPAGLTLNASTGAVSGTPTASGSGSFTVQVTDFSGGSATQQITYSVGGLLTITTNLLSPAAVGDAYSQTLMAMNNTGSVNWTVTSGSLPTGVTLSTAGVLSGTPTVSGSFTFGILASDSSPNTSTQTLTLMVGPALTMSSTAPQVGAVGETYSATLSASGGLGSYTWSVLNGSLPGGITLSTGGVLSGTPTASGAFTFTAKVVDQNSGATTGSVTVTINGALTLTTTSLPAATANSSYSQTLMATGGVGTYTWSVTGLPDTLDYSSSSGLISGTPTAGGSYPLTLKVTDGNSFSAMQSLTLTVNGGALTITTSTLPGATNGTGYNTTLAATGGVSPYTWSLSSGTLTQAGLAISAGGVISGTPNTTGGLAFTVKVTDGSSNSTTQIYTLAIAPATPPTYDFAVANEGGSIVRVSDLGNRDATICAADTCGSYYITSDAKGNIYSRNKTGIVKITPAGTVSTVLNFSTTNSVLASSAGVGGIALDGLGNIIFVDNSADAVFRVKTDGTGFTQVAPFPTLSPNEAQDTYVAVDTNGNYIVADDGGSAISVWRFTPTGTTGTNVLDGTISGGVSGLAIDPAGNYDVLDYIGTRVVGVTPNGGYNTLYSTVANDCCQLLGLTIEQGTSNLIIASSGSGALTRITPAGAATYISGGNLIGRPSSVVSIPAASGGPLTISPSSLPSGNTGQPYGPISLTASGGSGNYTWTGNGFPSGIGISSAGSIGGSTSQTGFFPISVTVTDTVTSQTGTANYSISIATSVPPLTITQAAGQLSTALGGSVSASFTASGGAPPYTFSASGLPGGVTINSSTGAISGTPTQAGTFSVGVQVSDQQPRTAGVSLTISVLGLTSGNLPAGVAGQSYSGSVGAVGGSGSYTFTATGLPTGLSLNSSSGAILGTVKTTGTYKFTVTVTDSNGLTLFGQFSITIAPPPALKITSSSLPGGNVGVPYGQGLTATGGLAPYTWAQSGGSLPAGMSFSSTGVVSGTPTAPGAYSFGAMATDTSGGVTTAGVSLTIQPAPLTITTAPTLPSGIAGFDYPMQVFTATGGTGAYTWSLSSGSLPAGIAFSGGVLSGNTGAVGTYALGVTVTDAASAKATASYSLTIRPASAADLLISTGSIGFTVSAPATSTPPAQNISVQSSQAGTVIAYSLAVSPTASWLSIQNGASTPDNISASLSASALTMPAGTYNTTLTLTCTSTVCAGHTQSVGVSLTVNNAPAALSVSTSLLSFGLSTASPVPASQTISLANAGGGSLLFGSVSCEASWCTVSGVPGTLTGGQSGSIVVTVDPTTAGPGFSRTQVDIVSSAGKASVPVNALVAVNPTMTLAPVGQQFGMPAGSGPGNPNGTFLVTVANGTANWSASVFSTNTPWLILGSTSGTSTPSQPGTVSYSIGSAAAALAPGAYYGQIQVTSSGVVDSPQVFEVVLNVMPATSASVPDAEPGGLLFITTAAATPPPQTVTVYTGSPSALTFQASVTPASVSSWLSVSAATGQTSQAAPGSVSVTVNPAKLSPGIYTAGVSFSLSAAAVRTVNVTLIVTPALGSATAGQTSSYSLAPKAGTCKASALAPTQTGLVNNFSAPVAWPTPLSIVLADNCGSLLTNGQIVATFSNGDPPLALTLANPSAGTYSATWTPRSAAAQMSITAHVSAPGYPATTAQIAGATAPNAAPLLTPHGTLHSFAPVVGAALAPGTIVQIYGQNLAAGTSQPTSIPLPTTSGGTSVIIGGISAPLYYVSAGQINAQIPFELNPLQPYQIIVSANGALTTPDTVNLTPAVPGFAAFGDGTLIAQHGDGSLVSATSPARSGEYLVAYLAGMGTTNATPASGAASPSSPLALPTVSPTLTINGVTSPIAFSGLTPGLVGLYQLNFQVPAGLPTGDITIVLSQAGAPTNQTVLPYLP